MIIAGTGHRPEKLGGHTKRIADALTALARDWLQEHQPDKVISGMALGWDQALAQAALDLRIPLIAAVPFDGFGNRWPEAAQYRCVGMLGAAFEVHIVHPYPGTIGLHLRNEWMVDRADMMLALWDGSWGGTFNCLRYAEKKGVQVENLWSRWQMREMLL